MTSSAQQAVEAPAGEKRWLGPDGQHLPFENDEQVLSFLRQAAVVSQKELTGGINRPLKVRLEKDGVQANAIFRIVDVKRQRVRLDSKLVNDFNDSFIYECAAYEVSRLLGIDNVPPCVRRRVELTDGSMQIWVEGARTEGDRREAGDSPPEPLRWLRQKQTMWLFDALIYNFDRNQGNMLVDSNWKLWFIDHTRSFRRSPVVEKLERIVWCEAGVWEKLRGLDKRRLSNQLGHLVSSVQIGNLLKRRDKLVAHLDARMEKMGKEAVLYDASTTEPSSVAGMEELVEDDDIPLTSFKLEPPGEDRDRL